MNNDPNIEYDEDTVNIYITGFVATLLEGTEGIEIRDKIIRKKGYINIRILGFKQEPSDVILANQKVRNKFPYFICHRPAVQLDRTILGLQVKIVQEDNGYCLELENHPDTIPDGVETVNVDITRFIALSLVEKEEIIDQQRVGKNRVIRMKRFSCANLEVSVMSLNYSENGRFHYMITNIHDKSDGPRQFLLYVKNKPKSPGESFYDYEDVGLDPSLELCRVGFIEEIIDQEDVIFCISYEYLKMNPKHYFGVPDFDLVYTWEDMKKIKESYDPHWCYRNPKTGEWTV